MNRLCLIDIPITDSTLKAAVQEMRAPCERQRHGQGRIGDFFRSVVRHIANGYPLFPRRRNIHPVISHARPADDLAVLQPHDRLARQLKIVVNHDRIDLLHFANQIVLTKRIESRNFSMPIENLTLVVERLIDEIRNQYFRKGTHN